MLNPFLLALLCMGISAVNTFRVIFDAYFGAQLGTLPGKSYVAQPNLENYRYMDVTDSTNTYADDWGKEFSLN
jgi:hypothetical protein